MIQFPTLLQAIDYTKSCPLCKGAIHFENDVQVERLKRTGLNKYITTAMDWQQDPRDWTSRTNITFTDDGTSYSDSITICLETQEVKRNLTYHKDERIGYGNIVLTGYSGSSANPAFKGDKHLGLGMVCRTCNNYDFMIQIVVALEHTRISKVLLNSESMSFIEKDGLAEIRNIYTMDKTIYNFFSSAPITGEPVFFKSQNLPLIPLDRENPLNTLHRIKNLLIFT
jgi:hypothetical protein